MSDLIPIEAQPKPDALSFDLDETLRSVVSLRSEIPSDAFTASILGTQREGSGVVIDPSGLILTIGYLVTEAEQIWLTTVDGTTIPGHPLAHDFVTGFGLVQALARVDLPAANFGSIENLGVGAPLVMAAGGGQSSALMTRLVAKREFAGYWEYLLDEAMFAMPAHPHWGGAGCFDSKGNLVGIGSLLVQVGSGDEDNADNSNMIVPADLLTPIIDSLLTTGKADRPARPWLGIYPTEQENAIMVAGVAPSGPGERAGIEQGDIIVEVDDIPIGDLADLYRQIWATGDAGVHVSLTILRENRRFPITIRTGDRADFLKKPMLH